VKKQEENIKGKTKILLIYLYHGLNDGVTPSGGVGYYLKSLFKHFSSDSFKLERFMTGRRPGKKSNIYYVFSILSDYVRFFLTLFKNDYVLVHFNTSFLFAGVIRDSIFFLIAKLYSKKIIVFWRGWSQELERWIDNNVILLRIFRSVFNKADAFIVLGLSFKKKLQGWGFNKEIFVETTTVDDRLLEDFSLDNKLNEINGCAKLQLLYLSRIEVAKGIIETIDAFSSLKLNDRELAITIAGDGPDYELMQEHIKKVGDSRIKVVGNVMGEEKRKILRSSHLFCLPTYYGEGLPNAIIEAMAFGMTIITRPVGGIPDIFIEGENGFYADSLDKDYLSNLLKNIITDREAMCKIAKNNYYLAQKQFLASIVAKRIENIYKKVVNG